MKLIWIEDAWEDYLDWYDKDKRVVKKVNSFIKDIQRNGYDGIGKPEPLKGNYSGWWSLKINTKDNIEEASLITGVEAFGFETLKEVTRLLVELTEEVRM